MIADCFRKNLKPIRTGLSKITIPTYLFWLHLYGPYFKIEVSPEVFIVYQSRLVIC